MNWRFWKKKEEAPQEEPTPWNPRIVFELVDGGRIHVTCDWPEEEMMENKVGMAQTFASMLLCIQQGQLLAMMQKAIAVTGHLKGDDRMSEYILGVLNTMLSSGPGQGQAEAPDARKGPVMPADEVFSRG